MPNTRGFRPGKALEHWGLHRRDPWHLAPGNQAMYELMADAFWQTPRPPGIAEAERKGNGDVIRFDPKTAHFGVVDNTGHIKTFYPADPGFHRAGTNADYFVEEIQK
jgi:hypothetical protein